MSEIRRAAQIRSVIMNYEALQMEIVPLATLTAAGTSAATGPSTTTGGRTPVPSDRPY